LSQFGARAGVLKARSTLNAIDAEIGAHPCSAARELRAVIERITASAHELVEIRLLNLVRLGALKLRDGEIEELERVVGGGRAAERLGLTAGAADADVRAAAADVLARWQARAENPLSSQGVKDAARAVARTCEGLLAAAGTTGGG
jgi:hypothetical protein